MRLSIVRIDLERLLVLRFSPGKVPVILRFVRRQQGMRTRWPIIRAHLYVAATGKSMNAEVLDQYQ
jgi:hypothetical protein